MQIGSIAELGLPPLLVVQQVPGDLVGFIGELILGAQAEHLDHPGLDVAPPLPPLPGLRRDRRLYLGLPGLPLHDLEGQGLGPISLGCSRQCHIQGVIFIVI